MTLNEAVNRAIQEPTLIQAQSFICIWECERAIKQAHKYLNTGVSATGTDKGWDTCFQHCLELVSLKYVNKLERGSDSDVIEPN